MNQEIIREYTGKLWKAQMLVKEIESKLDQVEGNVGYEPLPNGMNYGHVGDIGHIIELLSQVKSVVDEHVNGIVEMRENQVA